MDQLEDAGIVGPEAGTKPREILMSEEQLENYIEEYEQNDRAEEKKINMAKLIDGKQISSEIKEELKTKVASYKRAGKEAALHQPPARRGDAHPF